MVRGTDLQRISRTGRRSRQPHLDIRWVTNDLDHARLGLIVPRHGQTAVTRNRLQRRLRELWRREIQGHLPSIDVVIRTGPASYTATFAALRADLEAWLGTLS
ncbi:MAG TPA: ribonuclease P protein component [Gemmatimonadales bacterium]|nr:ribonuclease P protein component [Gemmatimonadales bacterium]